MQSFIVLLLCNALLLSTFLFSQDLSYSNIHVMTQMYNPALTAANNDFESSVSYRSHKVSNSKKLNSFGATFGSTLFPNRRQYQGNLTVGLNLYHQALNEQFNSTSVLGSTSYHVFMGKSSKLSVGLNYGLFSMGMNAIEGKWSSQHDGLSYDPSILSGENWQTNHLIRFDCGAGIQFSQMGKKTASTYLSGRIGCFSCQSAKTEFS